MRKISAIIVDDAPGARKLLRLMLQDIAADVEVKGEAASVPEAVELIKAEHPDVVFLDIEMPGQSGLKLVEQISRDKIPYEIVFTTAYNEYALRAFRLSSIDYLLKPIAEDQLLEAVDKLRKKAVEKQTEERLRHLLDNMNKDKDASLTIPSLNGYVFVRVADILYMKAEGSYVEIITANGKPLLVSKNLKYFEGSLKDFVQFVRVHRSYLINVLQMKRFDKAERGIIVMNDGKEIDLARDRRDIFFKAIKK
jgi:two-component system LytT family response regulator